MAYIIRVYYRSPITGEYNWRYICSMTVNHDTDDFVFHTVFGAKFAKQFYSMRGARKIANRILTRKRYYAKVERLQVIKV